MSAASSNTKITSSVSEISSEQRSGLMSLEDAKERLLVSIRTLPTEKIPLLEGQGRILAEDLTSRIDLPRFDNSAMDGYAVQSEDLRTATPGSPIKLRTTGRIGAGETFKGSVLPGECVRLFTGSALPAGADAVVMQEDVTIQGETAAFIEPVKPWENVRLRGEDIRAGSAIGAKGEKLNATKLSLLAATGHAEVLVHEAARVGILSTGSELVEPGTALEDGKIYESNRILVAGQLQALACKATILPLVRDDLKSTVAALEDAFSTNDFVITTGGVSVGELDFVKEAFQKLGGVIDLWKVAVRPGKPFVFGTLGEKRLFGLPGNPVSALVTYLLLVRPALLKAMGAKSIELPIVDGELTERLMNRGDRRHFVRARWENGKISVSGPQASHMIGALGHANCLVDVPPQSQLEVGTKVKAHLWEPPV